MLTSSVNATRPYLRLLLVPMTKLSLQSPVARKIALVGGVLVCVQLVFMTTLSTPPDAPTVHPVSASPTPTTPSIAATNEVPPSSAPGGRLTADMVAALPEDAPPPGFVYDSTGKRDPFRPFDFSPKESERDDLTPLERYDIGQLKLTAVLDGFDEPTAVVENAAGRGFTVKRGAKIGPNGGVITEVLKDKLVIVETTTDYTGETKSRTVELFIRTKDQKE